MQAPSGRIELRQQDHQPALAAPTQQPQPCRSSNVSLKLLNPEYEYQTLHGDKEIRLLKVDRYNDGTFRYHVVHTLLDDAPPFETVSWVWGSSARRHAINVQDGKVVRLNDNLIEAFPYISGLCSEGYLWIDQICIDQSNIHERHQQVKMMGQIYHSAVGVLAWLGVGPPPSPSLMNLLQIASEAGEEYPSPPIVAQIEDAYNEQCNINCIGEQEWFTRAWVFSEMTLAKKKMFAIGNTFISFYPTYWTLTCLYTSLNPVVKSKFRPHGRMSQCHRMMNNIAQAWYPIKQDSLSEAERSAHFTNLLSRISSWLRASDPRDHLYAFLGAYRGKDINIYPDYSLTYEQMLIETSHCIIRGAKSLDMITYAKPRGTQKHRRDLPSWVPHWALPLETIPMTYVLEDPLIPSRLHTLTQSCDANMLRVQGVKIDNVARTFEKMDSGDGNASRTDWHAFLKLDETLQKVQAYMDCSRICLLKVVLGSSFDTMLNLDQLGGPAEQVLGGFLKAYDDYVASKLCGKTPELGPDRIGLILHTRMASERSIFVTKRGRIGLGPIPCDDGDTCSQHLEDGSHLCEQRIICLLKGCSVFVVLQPSICGHYTFVGDCWLEDPKGGLGGLLKPDPKNPEQEVNQQWEIMEFV